MLTVYFSNNMIQAVVGTAGKKPSIQRICLTEAPEGSLINGVVTDRHALTQCLRDFWAANKLPKSDVLLVLHSTELANKSVTAPIQKNAAMLEFLRREYAEEFRDKPPVFGYWEMRRDEKAHQVKLFTSAAPRAYIEDVISLFADIGVTLSGLDSATGTALRLLGQLEQTRRATCIVQIADGVNLTNILLVDGEYAYSSMNRLFSAPGTSGYGVEIARQVSSILQFVKAQQIEQPIEAVCLAGLAPSDEAAAAEAIAPMAPEARIERLAAGNTFTLSDKDAFSRIVYAAGGLLAVSRRTDLIHNLSHDPERLAQKRISRRRMLPAVVACGTAAAVIAGMGVRWWMLQRQYEALENYLSDPAVISACAQYDAYSAENAVLQSAVGEMKDDWTAIDSYPRGSSALIQALEKYADGYAELTYTSFDAASGTLNITTTASDVEKINQYIAVLQQQDIFESVTYSGYSQNTDDSWSVNVSLVLSENAGK